MSDQAPEGKGREHTGRLAPYKESMTSVTVLPPISAVLDDVQAIISTEVARLQKKSGEEGLSNGEVNRLEALMRTLEKQHALESSLSPFEDAETEALEDIVRGKE